jgi:hypothetical protein
MIEIALDEQVIKIEPYMTIQQYQKFIKNQEIYKKSPIDLLSLWLKLPKNQIKDLPVNEVKFIENFITQELTKEFNEDKLYEVFDFKGIDYGLENNWGKLAWGAWIDLQVLSAENIENNLHTIMAILYRPVVKNNNKGKYSITPYKSDDIQERAELFRDLPVKYWLGVANFFFLTSQIYINNIKNSLKLMNKTNKLMMKGWNLLPKWVKRKLPPDTILLSHSNLQKKTLPSLNK